jgi:hypothetical protein
MKACRGIGGIVPLILNYSTRWKRVISFMTWSLHPGDRTQVPLYRRFCRSQNQSGHFGEEQNPWLLSGIKQ